MNRSRREGTGRQRDRSDGRLLSASTPAPPLVTIAEGCEYAANPLPSHHPLRVLVCDDDPSVGKLIRTLADPMGFSTKLTQSARQFRSSYQATVPDVIVLDLQIGSDTDGVEQIRFLSTSGYANPLILMSGFDDRVLESTERLGKGLGLRVVAALGKPFRGDQLRQILQEVEAEARAKRRLTPVAAKNSGDRMLEDASTRQELEAAASPITGEQLLRAIHRDELALEYQPIVTPDWREVLWLEALVRWEHPHLGRLAPDRFIPIAESELKTIDALTDWVISTALRQYRHLRDLGLVAPVAVNLSGRNLHDLTLPDRIYTMLVQAEVPAHHFCVELTETAVSLDPSKTADILNRLRLMGLQVALDDFGIGYSSLQQLRRLPFSAIKIDRSFVSDLMTSRDSLAIVRSIIDLARNMGLSCIAEGVETETTAGKLIDLGVDALQGYLIARPLPAEQTGDWLRERRPKQ
jgi:EAL domain-containing protein (putative c-di-GMP-specific phosphodiesterase class I)/CheY-like chemotaxis protein